MKHRPLNEYRAALLHWLKRREPGVHRVISIVQTSATNRGFHLVRITPELFHVVESNVKGRQVNSLWGNRYLQILSLPRYQSGLTSYYTISNRGREALEEWKAANGKAHPTLRDNGGA